MLPQSLRSLRRKNLRSPFRFTRLLAEHLEERRLLANVAYQLHLLPTNGAVTGPDLTSVSVGDSFDLAVTVQDVRTNPGDFPGVYAAYLDVGYDSSKAKIAQNGFVYSSNYPHGQSGTDATNLIDELGSFYGSISVAPGLTALEVVRVHMVAMAAGSITFTPDVSNMLTPAHYTLFYNSVTPVSPADISTGGAKTLTIGLASPITAVADQTSVAANADATSIDVLANDTTTPATGQTKNVVAVTQPAHGSVTFTATGVSYKPATDFAGTDTFTYTARNITAGNDSATATATVSVTVVAPITAVADSATMAVGAASTTIDVLANDTTFPATGQTKTVVSVGQPSHGSASIDSSGKVVYSPTTGFSGTDTFTYTARNLTAGANSLASTAVVTVTVPSSSSAVMHYQVRIVPTGGALFMPDPLNPHILIPTPDLSAVAVGGTYDLVVTVQASDPSSLGVFAGYLDIGYDESKTWVAAADANGNISAADFLNAFAPKGVQQIAGIASSSNYFTNGLSAGNLPNLIDDVGAFANTHLPNWPGELSDDESAAGVTVAPPRELVRATFRAVVAGSVTFTPDVSSLLHPAHDTLVLGSDTAVPISQIDVGSSRTITIGPAIVAVNDTANVAEDSGASSIDVLANDTTTPATGQTKTVAAVTQPSHGSVSFTDTGVVYTPAPDYFGPDAFTYTAQNTTAGAGSATATATVAVTVTSVNDKPTLDPISDRVINEDAAQQLVALSGISAGGNESQSLTLKATSDNPALTGDIAVNYSSPDSTGSLSFTPGANQSGTATITITVQDDGGTADGGVDTFTRTFVLTVNAINDAPTLDALSDRTINEDAGQQFVSLSGISAGINETQALTVKATSSDTTLISNLSINYTSADSTGSLTFASNSNQSGTATITVTVQDDGGTDSGGVDTVVRTFVVTVVAVNDPPTFTKGADQETNDEAGDVTVAHWATLISAGPADEGTQTVSFTVTADNKNLFATQPDIDAAGNLTFTPAMNVEGTTLVTVVLHDSGGTDHGGIDASDQQTFFIHVAKLHELHNTAKPFDASGDNFVTAADPLDCINYINAFAHGDGKITNPPPDSKYVDVNGDGYATAADPLAIINYINAFGADGEGENVAVDLVLAQPSAAPSQPPAGDNLADVIAMLALDASNQSTRRRN